MGKKCKNCEAPITGFWGKVARLWGVRQSSENPELCTTCAGEGNIVEQHEDVEVEKTGEEPVAEKHETGEVASVSEAMKDMGLNGHDKEQFGDHDCPGPDTCTHPSHKK
jgi:hypothetical protein